MNNSAIHTTFNKRVNKSNHLSNLLNCNYLRGNEIFRSYFRMLWRRRLGSVRDSSGGDGDAYAQLQRRCTGRPGLQIVEQTISQHLLQRLDTHHGLSQTYVTTLPNSQNTNLAPNTRIKVVITCDQVSQKLSFWSLYV